MIQIDIEMPESCYVCKFRKSVYGSLCTCMLNEEKYYETETYKNKRSDWCPLKEMQEPCDCISRAELLEAVDTWDKFGCDADTKLVPIKDCYVPYIHYDDVVKAIKGVPSIHPKPKIGYWIPISERLPKKTGLYLVSIGDLVTTANFDGHNFRTQAMVRFIPDAWMPLPEPYKPTYSEKE